MRFLYQNGHKYVYKRRIPHTEYFFSFSISHNKKKAEQIVRYFTKITKNFFNSLKDLKMAVFNIDEIQNILADYAKKALIEYSELEKSRHIALQNLFPVYQEIFSENVQLAGGHPEVIKKALDAYQFLAFAQESQYKQHITKHGNLLAERATPMIKELFKKFSNDDDLRNFFVFISMMFKTESSILKEDMERAERRFSPDYKVAESRYGFLNDNIPTTFTEELSRSAVTIDNVIEKYLFSFCGYRHEELNNSKSMATKANKIMRLIKDVCKELKSEKIVQFNEAILHRIVEVLHNVRMDKTGKGFLEVYVAQVKEIEKAKKEKREPELKQLRSADTVDKNLDILNRFLDFLAEDYITENQKKDYTRIVVNGKKHIEKLVKSEKLIAPQPEEAFSYAMLRDIFSKDGEYYQIIFKCLGGVNPSHRFTKPNGERLSTLSYWTKFYVPIILLLTGARLNEIAKRKTEDFEIDENGIAKFYIGSGKTKNARRIIVLHDFVVTNLRFKEFYEMAKAKKREYLFDIERDDMVGNTFNDYLKKTISKHLTKEDTFNNNRYSLHSLRHNFTSDLSTNGVTENLARKIQGHDGGRDMNFHYNSRRTEKQIDAIEKFTLLDRIDFSEFEKLTKNLEKSFSYD